jgi:hypothetical protein
MAISVTALHTTPVKSTRIRRVESMTVDAHGARGDRSFYVVDRDGAMVNAKRVAVLQTVVADYDVEAERLSLRLPDGREVAAPVRLGPEVPTTFFSAPRRARVLDGPWAAALSEVADQPLRLVRAGSAVDRGREGAVSLISRESLERLAAADGGEPIDARRFRMLIEVDGVAAHEEDGWIGRTVRAGEALLRMHGHVGRCATTTRGPETAKVDYPTLKLLATYRLDEPTTEPLAFGVHGEVLEGGVVRVGDPVAVVEPVAR